MCDCTYTLFYNKNKNAKKKNKARSKEGSSIKTLVKNVGEVRSNKRKQNSDFTAIKIKVRVVSSKQRDCCGQSIEERTLVCCLLSEVRQVLLAGEHTILQHMCMYVCTYLCMYLPQATRMLHTYIRTYVGCISTAK